MGKSIKLLRKAWTIRIQDFNEFYFLNAPVVYHESRDKAKFELWKVIYNDGWELCNIFKELTYINTPIIRDKEADVVLYKGKEIYRNQIEEVDRQGIEIKKREDIKNNPEVELVFIIKRGDYYSKNFNGYTSYKMRAGIYTKEEALKHVEGCFDYGLTIEPVNMKEIKDLNEEFLQRSLNELKKDSRVYWENVEYFKKFE